MSLEFYWQLSQNRTLMHFINNYRVGVFFVVLVHCLRYETMPTQRVVTELRSPSARRSNKRRKCQASAQTW